MIFDKECAAAVVPPPGVDAERGDPPPAGAGVVSLRPCAGHLCGAADALRRHGRHCAHAGAIVGTLGRSESKTLGRAAAEHSACKRRASFL